MNTPVRRVALAVMAMVLLLLANLTYVQVVKAADYRNDPLNQRVLLAEYSRQRGQITAGGQVLANSVQTDDRLRYQREFPDGAAYAPLTGYYSVIYDIINDAKALIQGLMAPSLQESFLGHAEIREVFTITKVGKVAGCRVTDGVVRRGAKVRLLRDDVVIHEGSLSTLKRFKDEVREVQAGYECGMAFENYQDIQVGDVIECFEIREVAAKL